MKKLLLFLLVTLQLLVLSSHVHSQKPAAQPALMWYVLSWPPTFCMNLKTGKCIVPIPEDIFTLHGLWPADANGKTISCPTKPDPDWDKLFLPIEAKLETFWPELKANQPKWSLWKHEWQKHGVCIGEDKSKEYFDSAISINDMFGNGNLFNYLETSGITPSDSKAYTKEDIIKAVQNVFSNSLPPPRVLTPLITTENVLSSLFDPRRPRSPPPRSPPPRSPPPRSPPPRSPPPRSPPPRSPPPRSPPPRPRSPPPPPRSPPPPPPRSPPPTPPRSPPPPPPRSPPPPPPRSPPPPPRSPPPPSPPPPPAPFNIYLRCTEIDNQNTTHAYLNEVILCTTLDGSSFISCPSRATNCDRFDKIVLPYIEPKPITPSPSPSLLPLLRSQEETYGTYPMFVQSWAKYVFND